MAENLGLKTVTLAKVTDLPLGVAVCLGEADVTANIQRMFARMGSSSKDCLPRKQTECLVEELLPMWFVIEFGSLRPGGYIKAFYAPNDGVRACLQKARLLEFPACHFHSGYATDLCMHPYHLSGRHAKSPTR